jgi:hypothetical protein
MTILCLAIVGKNNEPLYLCHCDFDKNAGDDAAVDDKEDVFGFASDRNKEGEPSLSLDHEVGMECSFFVCILSFLSLLPFLIYIFVLCTSF